MNDRRSEWMKRKRSSDREPVLAIGSFDNLSRLSHQQPNRWSSRHDRCGCYCCYWWWWRKGEGGGYCSYCSRGCRRCLIECRRGRLENKQYTPDTPECQPERAAEMACEFEMGLRLSLSRAKREARKHHDRGEQERTLEQNLTGNNAKLQRFGKTFGLNHITAGALAA